MNTHMITIASAMGLFIFSGCTSTIKVTADEIHDIPMSGTVSEFDGWDNFTLYFKNEGILNKISSVQCFGFEHPMSVNMDNQNLMVTRFTAGTNYVASKVLKIIVSPPDSGHNRTRTIEIPLQLIHDTFLNNADVSSFLEGESNNYWTFDEVH